MSVTAQLRDPTFLLWLQRFVGLWEVENEVYEIRRRGDGWLVAARLDPYERVPLAPLLELGHRSLTFDLRTLGPRPVLLSARLMQRWLTPQQQERLRGAGHAGRGRKRILETIEQRMQTLPAAELKARWIRQWELGYQEDASLPPADRQAHEALYRSFQAG